MLTLAANSILIVMLTIYAVKQIKRLKILARVTPYMILEKRKLSWTRFLMHSLTIAPLFWCFTVEKLIIKPNIYMNDVCD